MKNLFLILLSVIVGGAITALYLEYRVIESPQPIVQKEVKPTAPFSLVSPPSDSLTGKIMSREGSLLWESRMATAPAELTGTTTLSQGERIVTEEDSEATLEFERFGKIVMSQDSDLSFPQTLPTDFVVNQRKGDITYELSGEVPLSIRARNSLITKDSGKIRIEITEDESVILVSTLEGTAKIGFNDTENVSQVFTLREGQVYEYNSDERTAINQNLK